MSKLAGKPISRKKIDSKKDRKKVLDESLDWWLRNNKQDAAILSDPEIECLLD